MKNRAKDRLKDLHLQGVYPISIDYLVIFYQLFRNHCIG